MAAKESKKLEKLLELIGSVEEQELLGEESTTPIAVCTGLATLFDGGDMLINNVLNAIEFGQEHTNITYVNDGEVVFAWGGTEEEVLGELKQTVLDELEEESNKEKYKQLLKKEGGSVTGGASYEIAVYFAMTDSNDDVKYFSSLMKAVKEFTNCDTSFVDHDDDDEVDQYACSFDSKIGEDAITSKLKEIEKKHRVKYPKAKLMIDGLEET